MNYTPFVLIFYPNLLPETNEPNYSSSYQRSWRDAGVSQSSVTNNLQKSGLKSVIFLRWITLIYYINVIHMLFIFVP